MDWSLRNARKRESAVLERDTEIESTQAERKSRLRRSITSAEDDNILPKENPTKNSQAFEKLTDVKVQLDRSIVEHYLRQTKQFNTKSKLTVEENCQNETWTNKSNNAARISSSRKTTALEKNQSTILNYFKRISDSNITVIKTENNEDAGEEGTRDYYENRMKQIDIEPELTSNAFPGCVVVKQEPLDELPEAGEQFAELSNTLNSIVENYVPVIHDVWSHAELPIKTELDDQSTTFIDSNGHYFIYNNSPQSFGTLLIKSEPTDEVSNFFGNKYFTNETLDQGVVDEKRTKDANDTANATVYHTATPEDIPKSERGVQFYHCNDCRYKCRTKRKIRSHIYQRHSENKIEGDRFKCSNCEKVFKTVHECKQHERFCGVVNYECKLCNKQYKYQKLMRYHLQVHHADEIDPSEFDNIYQDILKRGIESKATPRGMMNGANKFTSIMGKRKAEAIETKKVKIYCLKCDKTSDILGGSRRQMKEICLNCSSECCLKCQKCEKLFRTWNSIVKHLRYVCDPQEFFKCRHCDYVGKRKDRFQNHEKIHMRANAEAHQRNSMLESGGNDSMTVRDIQSNSPEGSPSIARESAKSCEESVTRYNLKRIARGHFYHCNDCDYEAYQKSDIQLHILNEHGSDLGLLYCSICGKTYDLIFPFQKHKLTCGLVQYNCKYCPKTWPRLTSYIKSHLKSHHSGELGSKSAEDVHEEILMEASTKKDNILKSIQVKAKKARATKCNFIVITDEQVKLYCSKCNKNFDIRRWKGKLIANRNCPDCDLVCRFQCTVCEKLFLSNHSARDHVRSTCYPQQCSKGERTDCVTGIKSGLPFQHISHTSSKAKRNDYVTGRKSDLPFQQFSHTRRSTKECRVNMLKSIQRPDNITENIDISSNCKFKLHCQKCNGSFDASYGKGKINQKNCTSCSDVLVFKCSKCNKLFRSSTCVRIHVREICYPENIFDCNHCDYFTTRIRHLHRHIKHVHPEGRPAKRRRTTLN